MSAPAATSAIAEQASIYHFVRSLGPVGGAAPDFVPAGGAVRTPVITIPAH